MPWVDESLLAVLNSLEMQYTWLNQTKYLPVRWLTGNSFWNFCGIDCLPSAVLKVCSYPLPLALLTIMCCCFCLGLSSSSSFLKCFLPSLFSPFNSFLYKKKNTLLLPLFTLSHISKKNGCETSMLFVAITVYPPPSLCLKPTSTIYLI